MSDLSLLQRRDLLEAHANPRPDRNYLVGFEIALECTDPVPQTFMIHLRYVPDRLVLATHQAAAYFSNLANADWQGPEGLAHLLIDDLNNELVPRWLTVTVTTTANGIQHHASVEDRQPHWDNASLLAAGADVRPVR